MRRQRIWKAFSSISYSKGFKGGGLGDGGGMLFGMSLAQNAMLHAEGVAGSVSPFDERANRGYEAAQTTV